MSTGPTMAAARTATPRLNTGQWRRWRHSADVGPDVLAPDLEIHVPTTRTRRPREVGARGHGLPVFGADRIRTALLDTAEVLDAIEDQTVALMNSGCTLDRAIHEVAVPEHLKDRPFLRAVYDHPQFVVRNVWRRYGGWHDGEPDNLLPAPRAELAGAWVDLAGGVGPVITRALALADAGNLRLACHLVEAAVLADPTSDKVHAARARIYEERAAEQESSMARNILHHAAVSSGSKKRDIAGDF